MPIRLLLIIPRYSKFVKAVIEDGMVPRSKFEVKTRRFKDVKKPVELGIVPLILFMSMSKVVI